MNLIKSAFLVTSLLALSASAQPAPSSTPPVIRPGSTPPPNGRPMPNLPPGLMPGAPKTPAVMPDKDKLSYAIGYSVGGNIKKDGLDIDVDVLATAMKDVLGDRTTRFNEKEVKEIMMQFQGALRAKMTAEREKQMAEAKAKNEEFLSKNAKDPAVKTLPNGLQYKVLKEGAGEMPKPTDSVTVSYKGRLVDGTLFDQNTNFPTPVTGQTIKGWSEVLPLMKTGSKWEVVIPSDLGYGARGMPPKIPANSVLIFEMELLSISAGPPPAAAHPTPAAGPHAALQPSAFQPTTSPPAPPSANVVSGQIIKVPSADELKKGAKIEVITNVPSNNQ